MEKTFTRQEGLDKLKEMVEDIRVCMFITNTESENHVRPMATVGVEPNGSLWFFTKSSSFKIADIRKSGSVQLLFSHPGKDAYADIRGKAYLENSREKMEALWTPLAKAWFPEGIDDPEICLLKVEVDSAYYWDSGSGKMVSFLKMLAAAVTGKQLAAGEEGVLIH